MIEYNVTEKIFTKPDVKQTEDYITGRFAATRSAGMEEKRHTSHPLRAGASGVKEAGCTSGRSRKAIEQAMGSLLERDSASCPPGIAETTGSMPWTWSSGGEVHPPPGPPPARRPGPAVHHHGHQDQRPPGANRRHGLNIAQKAITLNDEPQLKPYNRSAPMAEITRT
jgi:hypothetical protein